MMEVPELNEGYKATSTSTSKSVDIKPKGWNVGIVIGGIIGGTGLGLSIIALPFITPALRKICLPYVPATNTQVTNVFRALDGRKGRLIDLGSGDGRLVHEAARQGFIAHGVELNPWLVLYSKFRSFQLGIWKSTSFHRKNLWKVNLKPYDNVVIFGVDTMMEDLEVKCKKELSNGGVVAACRFAFPQSSPTKVIGEGIDTVWLYEFKKHKS